MPAFPTRPAAPRGQGPSLISDGLARSACGPNACRDPERGLLEVGPQLALTVPLHGLGKSPLKTDTGLCTHGSTVFT